MFTGSICDREAARKTAGSVLMGQTILGVTAGSLSSVATAQAAAATQGATMSICDQIFVRPTQRGYRIASNFGAPFSSNYATLYAALPDSSGHVRNMIQG